MNRIIITMSGGLVQDVEDVPPGTEVEVRDFDTEGATPDELVTIDGKQAYVKVMRVDGEWERVRNPEWAFDMGDSSNGDAGYVAYATAPTVEDAALIVQDALQGNLGHPSVADFDGGAELVRLRFDNPDRGHVDINICFNADKVTPARGQVNE